MGNNDKPCCAADALRRIKQLSINGIPTGLCMLDECIAEVKQQDLHNDTEIRAVLMKRVKVYNYIPTNVEEAYVRAILDEFHRSPGQVGFDRMTKIEILGTGCAKCKRLFDNAGQAVKDLKITAEIVKVDDIAEIVSRGIMLPPALFINGEVRAEGRIPDVNEIKKMLTE